MIALYFRERDDKGRLKPTERSGKTPSRKAQHRNFCWAHGITDAGRIETMYAALRGK